MNPQPYEAETNIPSKPLDIVHEKPTQNEWKNKSSFKDMLTASSQMTSTPNLDQADTDLTTTSLEEEEFDHASNFNVRGIKRISLTEEDRQRIYEPWKCSIIIKLVGKCMLHHYLKKKIQELWKPTEEFSLIDLG